MLQIYLQLLETEKEKNDFELLYETYRKLMHWVSKKILYDDWLAEDAVHEAFLRVIKNFQKVNKTICPDTRNFMVTIVRNVTLNMQRKQMRENENNIYYDFQEDVRDKDQDKLKIVFERMSCELNETEKIFSLKSLKHQLMICLIS